MGVSIKLGCDCFRDELALESCGTEGRDPSLVAPWTSDRDDDSFLLLAPLVPLSSHRNHHSILSKHHLHFSFRVTLGTHARQKCLGEAIRAERDAPHEHPRNKRWRHGADDSSSLAKALE